MGLRGVLSGTGIGSPCAVAASAGGQAEGRPEHEGRGTPGTFELLRAVVGA